MRKHAIALLMLGTIACDTPISEVTAPETEAPVVTVTTHDLAADIANIERFIAIVETSVATNYPRGQMISDLRAMINERRTLMSMAENGLVTLALDGGGTCSLVQRMLTQDEHNTVHAFSGVTSGCSSSYPPQGVQVKHMVDKGGNVSWGNDVITSTTHHSEHGRCRTGQDVSGNAEWKIPGFWINGGLTGLKCQMIFI